MTVRCLLWDFGDTLCDELSLWRASDAWMEVYRSFDEADGIGNAWSLGELDLDGFVAELTTRLPLGADEIRAHLARADLFDFFPFTESFFRAHHLPQAIVTINPAAFRDLALELGFAEVTETIVISAEERTLDKGALCQIALGRMPGGPTPGTSLLIDDKAANLEAWAARGGVGYLYTTDAAFERDVAGGIDGLVQRQPGPSSARRTP